MKFLCLIISFLTFYHELIAVTKIDDPESYLIFSFPKSGTHFIMSLFTNTTGQNCKGDHVHHHINFSPRIFHIELADKKIIFPYRDPRDAIISYIDWVDNLPEGNSIKRQFGHPEWNQWDEKTKLIEVIRGEKVPSMCQNGKFLVENINMLLNRENAIVVRFEDFIGPKGGGDFQAQYVSVKQIMEFITKKEPTNEEVLLVCSQSFGASKTFNRPGIGKWKYRFSQEVKDAFKNSFWNDVLIELGYETSYNW